MVFPRRALAFLALSWAFVTLYPDPGVLVASVRNLFAAQADPAAVRALAETLPDDPRAIERRVLVDVVPYATDWEAAGVPWQFPTAAQAVQAGRGDCESRALVLASILAAKGIPYELRMSFDHMWVDYPGKAPTAAENEGRVLAGRGTQGWSWPRWPDDIDLGRELRAQIAIYWDPMPTGRRALLFAGIVWIALWNGLATRLGGAARAGRAAESRGDTTLRSASTPSSAAGGASS